METLMSKSQPKVEKSKPVPSKNHSLVQGNTYFHLRVKYPAFPTPFA
jgi:hypothetical protein